MQSSRVSCFLNLILLNSTNTLSCPDLPYIIIHFILSLCHLFFPERTWCFSSGKKRTNEHHSDGIFQHKKIMLLKFSITMAFTFHILSWCKMSSPFRENDNVIVFLFPFQIFMPLANFWFIVLPGWFPILRTIICHDLYLLIRPSSRLIALGRRRVLISGFIQSASLSILSRYEV